MIKKAGKRWKLDSYTPRQRRWAVGILLGAVLYSIVGFLLVPWIVKSQIEKQLPPVLKRNVTVAQVRMNPWTLSLTVRGLNITETNAQPFASLDELYANLQLSSIFRRGVALKDLRLVGPKAILIRHENGELNIADILAQEEAPASPPEEKGSIPRIFIGLLTLTNGFVRVEDHALEEPFRMDYQPINFELRDLTTVLGERSSYAFNASSPSGVQFEWEGGITVQPPGSAGSIKVRHFSPGTYQPYLNQFTSAQITGGEFDVRGEYLFALHTNGVDLVLTNGRVQLSDFQVIDRAASDRLVSLPEFLMDGIRFNLRDQTAGVGLLRIADFEVNARINEDGRLNFQTLLLERTNRTEAATTNAPAESDSAPWTFDLAEFDLRNAAITFEDRSRQSPFETRLNPIDLLVLGLTTRSNESARFTLGITTEAEEEIRSDGVISLTPVSSAGEWTVNGVELAKYRAYAEEFLRGEIASGKVSLGLNYAVALGGPEPSVIASNLVVRVIDLGLKGSDSDELVVSVPEFSVEGGRASLEERSASIARVTTTSGSILARLQTNGAINLAELIHAPPASKAVETATAAADEEAASPSPDWRVAVGEVAVDDYAITFEDHTVPEPAVVKLAPLSVRLKGFDTVTQRVDLRFTSAVNEDGALAAEGAVNLAPLSADLQVGVTNLDLRISQSYLQPFARVVVDSGRFDLGTRVQLESAADGSANPPEIRVGGDFSISNLAVSGEESQPGLFAWTNFTVNGFDFALPSQQLTIERVFLDGLHGAVVINSNRQANVASVLVQSTNAPVAVAPEPPGEAADPAAQEPLPPLAIQLVLLTNTALRFVDQSVQPPVQLGIESLRGTITGLSSTSAAPAQVQLDGVTGEQSEFSVSGAMQVLAAEPFLDLAISNRNFQLSPLSGYAEQFVGYPINRGRLSTGLKIDLAGDGLKAENLIRIEQLTLGARIDNTNATKLPVKLAVALLKDSAGQIELNIPLAGSLNDPQFKIGPVVGQVLGNIITRAVASPFKLLGAAVGGGEELSYLEFIPGTAEFVEGETNKVTKLVKALQDRGLDLDLHSSIELEQDRAALARGIVDEEIETARLEELASAGQEVPDPGAFQVEPFEKARLLRAAVAAEFGPDLDAAVAEVAAARSNLVTSAAATARADVKWYKKVLIPFQSRNNPEAIARAQAKADAELLEQNPGLATLTPDLLRDLLATRVEIDTEMYLKLLQARNDAARGLLIQAGLPEERILSAPPRAPSEGQQGKARVELSLN